MHELKFVKGWRAIVKHCPLVQEAIHDAEILSYKKSFTFSHISIMASYTFHTATVVIFDIF